MLRAVGVDVARGQVEPTTALACLLAVCLALSLYATVLDGAAPPPTRDLAGPTLSRVHDAVVDAGVADPARLAAAGDAGPEGYALRASLSAGALRWSRGPSPPTDADTAGRSVPVRIDPGRVRHGRLRVAVWESGGDA